ncbi:MAG: SRPBCC family protein, partial [Acidobacteriota bacterium]
MTPISVSCDIAAPVEHVFARAVDFAHAAERIEAILAVEMLSEGPVGVGTRFRETRKMFGKEASETMEVSTFEPPRRYVLSAESHGARYRSTFTFEPTGHGTRVTRSFEAIPLTFFARLMSFLMNPM